GTAVVICRIVDPRLSLSWDRDTLVFSQPDGIMRVPSSGGKPEAIVRLKPGERVHGPHMLPDRQTVLFTLATGTTRNGWGHAEIVAQSLTTGTRRTILQGANDARYLPTGHLLFAVRGVLLAKPFNPARLELTGDAVPIVEGVRRAPGGSSGAAQVAVSNTGSMVYLPGPTGGSTSETTLSIIDENGAIESLDLAPGQYESPRISPDGKRLAFGSEDGRQSSIFVYDLDGSSAVRRLTFGGNNRFPVWSRDSRHIAFQSDREGDTAVFWQPADISGSAAERLTKPEPGAVHIPELWSRKDDVLAFSVVKDGTATLWMFSAGDKKATRFSDVRSPAPLNSEFSPDGKWLAYTLRADAIAVYVESFPAGAKYQISKPDQLSHHPSWSLDGKTLFYVPGALSLVGVSVTTQPTFSIGNPR